MEAQLKLPETPDTMRDVISVGVGGHRPQRLSPNQRAWFQSELQRAIPKVKADTLACGMAIGVDLWAARIALAAGMKLHAFVPFPGQEKRWSAADQKEYIELLNQATQVVMVSERSPQSNGEAAKMLHQRNHALIDTVETIIICWDTIPRGGTYQALRYAAPKMPVILIRSGMQTIRYPPNAPGLTNLL